MCVGVEKVVLFAEAKFTATVNHSFEIDDK